MASGNSTCQLAALRAPWELKARYTLEDHIVELKRTLHAAEEATSCVCLAVCVILSLAAGQADVEDPDLFGSRLICLQKHCRKRVQFQTAA